jgi:hypothetical protein
MTATTIERLTQYYGAIPARGTFPIAANTKILKGTLVGLDSAGRAIAATTAATCVRVVGKASSTVNNLTGSELGGAAAAADVEVEYGVFNWANSAGADEIAADDVGKLCYAVDNQTVALTSNGGTRQMAGLISGFYDSKVEVWNSPLVPVFYDTLTTLASTANAEGASLIGIEDAATNFTATNVEAALAEIIADYAATTATNGANKIGFQDSGNKTANTTVDAVLDELLVDGTSANGEIVLEPTDFVLFANGAPLAVYSAANDGSCGLYSDGTNAVGIRWNNTGATTVTVAAKFKTPTDMDLTVAPTYYVKCAKTGATAVDNPVIAVGVFAQTEAALYDAGADLGANTGAVAGDAIAKTVQLVNTGAATVLPSVGSSYTLTVNPAAADLATDDLIVFEVIVKYTRKLRTA